MPRGAYWIYYLDQADNFLDAEPVAAKNDIDAFLRAQNLQARTYADDCIVELWHRDRMIMRLEPEIHKQRHIGIV